MAESEKEIFSLVVKESGKTDEEIRDMIEKRKKAAHGLLSDYGALYAVAKELGVSLDGGPANGGGKLPLTKLSDVKPKVACNVVGRVKSIFPPKEFQKKDGSTGRLARIILLDDSGEGRVVLWDNGVEVAERIKRGDVIMVKNGYGKEALGGGSEVHVTSLSTVLLNPGVEEEPPLIEDKKTKIKDVSAGMGGLNLTARITSFYPATSFTRSDGTEGFRSSFTGEDESGSVRFVVWGEAAKKDFSRGDIVRVENAYAKEGRSNDVEVHIGNGSSVEKSEEKLKLKALKEPKDLKVADITPNMQNINISARVMRTYEPRAYSGGTMASLVLGDESGTVRAVLWNEKSPVANELKRGDGVKIKNAYAKANLNNEAEIHVGKYSDVVIAQELEIAPIKDIEKAMTTEKKIADLTAEDRFVRIKGRIVSVDEDRRVTYMVCGKCGKRIQNMGEVWVCESCGGETTPAARMKVSFMLDDGSSNIRVVSFGENAEKVLGVDAEEAMNMIGETQDEFAPVKNAKESLLNQTVSVVGNVRYNDFSDQLEFLVSEIEF